VYSKEGCEVHTDNYCPELGTGNMLLKNYSSTFVSEHTRDSVNYVLGFVEGVSAKDRFCFDPKDEKSCLTEPLSFLEARNSLEMDVYQGAGIFGLAPDSFDKIVRGFVDQLKTDIHGPSKGMFSIYISPDNSEYSKLIFGQYNISKFAALDSHDEDIVWSPLAINNGGGWVNDMESATFWGEKFAGDNYFVADSGTSYGLMPKQYMAKFIAILTKEGYKCSFFNFAMGFYFCNNGPEKTYDDLPDL
jgi:hypothetical protein